MQLTCNINSSSQKEIFSVLKNMKHKITCLTTSPNTEKGQWGDVFSVNTHHRRRVQIFPLLIPATTESLELRLNTVLTD